MPSASICLKVAGRSCPERPKPKGLPATKMSVLLVIGGTGFFGKSILEVFQQGGLAEWGISRVVTMSRNAERLIHEAPQLINERVSLISADVGAVDDLPRADYVIHAAASTDAASYLSRPQIERENILAAVYNYCRLAPVFHRHSKILYVSSGAVYGTQPFDLPMVPEDFIVEDPSDIPEGKRDYAIAKRHSEDAFRKLGENGLDVSIARCFAFVGPWLPRDKHFAIGNFLRDALLGQAIKVNATFPVFRSYMHSDDLVRWLMVIAEHATQGCPCFNVGSDEAVTMDQLARAIGEEFGLLVSIPVQGTHQVDRYVPSIAKAKELLGLNLSIGLKTAIRKTVQSIRSVNLRD